MCSVSIPSGGIKRACKYFRWPSHGGWVPKQNTSNYVVDVQRYRWTIVQFIDDLPWFTMIYLWSMGNCPASCWHRRGLVRWRLCGTQHVELGALGTVHSRGTPEWWRKIPTRNGWWLGVPLWLRKPPYFLARTHWSEIRCDRSKVSAWILLPIRAVKSLHQYEIQVSLHSWIHIQTAGPQSVQAHRGSHLYVRSHGLKTQPNPGTSPVGIPSEQ